MKLKELLKIMVPEQEVWLYTDTMGDIVAYQGSAGSVPWIYADLEIYGELGTEKEHVIGIDVRESREIE